jgi:hypothetical protein
VRGNQSNQISVVRIAVAQPVTSDAGIDGVVVLATTSRVPAALAFVDVLGSRERWCEKRCATQGG